MCTLLLVFVVGILSSAQLVPGLDEFDHGHDSDEDESRNDMYTTVIPADQPAALVVIVPNSLVVEEPF